MNSDKDFYGRGEHPEAGTQLVFIDGKAYSKVDIDYLKSQSPAEGSKGYALPKSLNRIKSDTVNSAGCTHPSGSGFSKSRTVEDTDERKNQMDRLAIRQNTEARLAKDLERTRRVIASIKQSLENN